MKLSHNTQIIIIIIKFMKNNTTPNEIGWEKLINLPWTRIAFHVAKRVALAFCVVFAFIALPANAQTTGKISVNVSGVPLSSVMKQIESQSGYTFFYNASEVNVNKSVSVTLDGADINAALSKVFANTDITYTIDNKHVILGSHKVTTSQSKSNVLSGTITDKTGYPIIGAVVIPNSDQSLGATTDVDGNYSLPWSPKIAKDTITVSILGYKTQALAVNGRQVINVVLEEDAQLLEGTVVTALGIKRSERSVAYNVQAIDSKEFNVRDANLVNSLGGKLAGVQINSTPSVGGETRVVMRGQKSIAGGNNALYVLDGIPLPTLSTTTPGDGFSIMRTSTPSGDGISNFNSEDIASMSALVGPSSAALYGYKAQNGILMLTTRTAEEGVSVSYNTNTTFSNPFMLPDIQSTYGAKDGVYASWGNKLTYKPSWSYKDFFQTGYNTSHSVSLSIGKESSSTYLSAAYTDAQGIIPNNDYTRYNFTMNHTEDFLKDRLHLSVLAMYMNVEEQNMLNGGQYYNPLIPVYLMSPSDDINKYAVYERYNASRNFPTQYWPWGSMNLQAQNPFWIVNRNMFNNKKNRYLLGGSLKYEITDWIDISGRVRTDFTDVLAEQKNYASTSGLFAGDKGRYFHDSNKTIQTYADVLVNIHKTFGDDLVQLNANIGASVEDYLYRQAYAAGDLLGVPNLFTFSNMDTGKGFYKNTYRDQTQSVFATAQIGFKNMVFLDATFRSDWNTAMWNTKALPTVYSSVGLSGVLTDIFNIDSNWLSFLKVRGSYAEVGSPITRFLSMSTFPVTSGQPAKRTYAIADNFQAERTRSWEVGADARLWGGKLNLNATYYHSMTGNQVFTPEVPASAPWSTLYLNAGRVDNKGIELSVELNQNLGPVEWTSNLIYSRNKNKVVRLLDATYQGYAFKSDKLSVGGNSGVQMWLREGHSIGDIFVRGLKTDEHGFIWVSPTAGTVVPADVTNGIDDMIYAGNINPAWTGSWRNTFSWKGLSLGVLLTARVGGVGVSLTEATLDSYGMSQRTADARDNGGALVNGQRIPAQDYFETIGGNGSEALGAYYTYSMTNIRLGELTLGYDIPVTKWQNVIKGLNVAFVGKNLAMLYCKAPFDPEVASGAGNYAMGIDYFNLPSTRNLGFSVKITF